MNKTLEKIILDWIGENRDSRYSDADGVNSALSDLRARVPELVEKIEVSVDKAIGIFKEEFLNHNGVHSKEYMFDFYTSRLKKRIIYSLTKE